LARARRFRSRLEAGPVTIQRDVVAEFRNPVMLHVTLKAFAPGRLPFSPVAYRYRRGRLDGEKEARRICLMKLMA
jgi:hypothetical protein